MTDDLFFDIKHEQSGNIVELRFKPYWRNALLTGKKVCTTRTSKYGNPGDYFTAFWAKFKITAVHRVKLSTVRDYYWEKEGCTSPAHFESVWCSIHPAAMFKPDLIVYLHEFKKEI